MRREQPLAPRSIELAAYGLVALGAVLPALLHPGRVVGDGADLYGTLWFYWWIQDCAKHLRDPSFTTLFFHPLGKDIFAHTGDNFVDALASVPFQWVFRFPLYQPVFVAVVLLGDALSFRGLARRLVLSARPGAEVPAPSLGRDLLGGRLPPAALAATLLWQTHSYLLFELTCGRVTQAFLWFLPLAVDRFLWLESPRARPRDALLAGLFTALQAWTYWFMGHYAALLFAWFALLGLLGSPRRRALLGRYALAAAGALLAVSPAVLLMARKAASGEVPGLLPPGTGLLDPPPPLANNVATELHGYWLMETRGAPLLGHPSWLAVLLLLLLLGRDRLRWLGGTALVLLFSLGPELPGGLPNLPYRLAYHLLPFFDRLWFPYRGVVFAFLLLAAGAGPALDRLMVRWPRRAALAAPLLVGALSLLDQHAALCWPLVTRDFTPPRVYRWIGRVGGGLVELPIGVNGPSIVWQTVHGQPLFGGMGESAPLLWPEGYRDRLRIDLVRYLRHACAGRHPHPPRSERGRERLLSEGFRWVLLHRDLLESLDRRVRLAAGDELPGDWRSPLPARVVEEVSRVLGEPLAVEGPIVLWSLSAEPPEPPPGLRATPERLAAPWEPESPPAFERYLRSRGRLGGEREHHPGG